MFWQGTYACHIFPFQEDMEKRYAIGKIGVIEEKTNKQTDIPVKLTEHLTANLKRSRNWIAAASFPWSVFTLSFAELRISV